MASVVFESVPATRGAVPAAGSFLIGGARFHPDLLEIEVDGDRVRIRRKLMDAAAILVRREGQLVSRDEFLEALWPDRIPADESLTQLMSELRRLLAGPAFNGARLSTISGRGYRLAASITPSPAGNGGGSGSIPAPLATAAGLSWPTLLLGAIAIMIALALWLIAIGPRHTMLH